MSGLLRWAAAACLILPVPVLPQVGGLLCSHNVAHLPYRLVAQAFCSCPAAQLLAASTLRLLPVASPTHPLPHAPTLRRIASFKDLSLQALQAAADDAAAGTGGSHPSPLVGPPTLRELHSGDSGSGAATAAAPAVSSAASNGVRQPQQAAVEKPQQPPAASSGSTGAGSSEGGGGTSSGGGLRRRPFEQRAEELTALANRWVVLLGGAAWRLGSWRVACHEQGAPDFMHLNREAACEAGAD